MPSDHHARPGDLVHLVQGNITRAEAIDLVFHLQACEECLFAFRKKYRWDLGDLWSWLLDGLQDVEPAKGRGRPVSQQRHEAEARLAKEGLRRLREVAPEKRHLIVRNSWAFASLAAVQVLLDETQGQWHKSPKWAVHWAELALTAMEALPTATYPLPLVADYAARAWSYLGNARRLCADYATAESHLRTAAFWLGQGTRDTLELATLWRFEMRLALDQLRFASATDKARRALDIYRRENNSFWRVWVENSLGVIKLDAEDYPGAIQCFETVLRQPDLDEAGLKAQRAAHQNLALALLGCDRLDESWRHWEMARSIPCLTSHPTGQARLDLLKGRLLAKTAGPGPARAVLHGVRDVFLEEGASCDAALVNLDLARVSLTQGKGFQAREHAEKALSVFLNRGLQHDANEATMLLCRSLLVR